MSVNDNRAAAGFSASTTATTQTTATFGSPTIDQIFNTVPGMTFHRRVGDLCNPFHAIFRRSNFKNISDELAVFPHAVLVAYLKHFKHPENEELDEWSFHRKASKLSKMDMAMYNLKFAELADMINFIIEDSEDYMHAFCVGKFHDVTQNSDLWMGSTIHFSRKDIETHVAYAALPSDDPRVMEACFWSARLFLHELMHSFSITRLGEHESIPFENNKIVETGYEWEDFALGGVMDYSFLKTDACQTGMIVCNWPCASITRHYKHKGYAIDILQEPAAEELWWWAGCVYDKALSNAFTIEFWERAIPEQCGSALRPPKVRGYWVRIAEDGQASLIDPTCESLKIPAGYVEDVDGEIVIDLPEESESELS